jgi:F-type H+-transporting ATPase subunit delta
MGGARFFQAAAPRSLHEAHSSFWSFERVENSGGIQASLAGRYATALFGLARDENQIDAVTRSLDRIEAAMAESADFKTLVTSPLIGRTEAGRTVRALTPTLGVDPITAKFLGVLADNGRLSELKAVIKSVRQLAAGHRGETTAEVTSAFPLNDDQVARLKSNLKARLGRDVVVDAKVDPQLLGGLVVRHGSQMIDASIRTKLNTLANAMKG